MEKYVYNILGMNYINIINGWDDAYMFEERDVDELILLIKRFLFYADNLYKSKEISDHEYEILTCNKIAFLNNIEKKAINNNDIACGLEPRLFANEIYQHTT